jgi:two-component system response regulator
MGTSLADRPRHILVADDSDDDVELLCRAVAQAKLPWTITAVLRDGEHAIRHLETFVNPKCASPPPEMLLLDLKMPRAGGFEVLDWIRRNTPKQMQTIVFSSSSRPADIQRARELGANGYIVKPATFDELLAMVKRLEDWMLEHYSTNKARVP